MSDPLADIARAINADLASRSSMRVGAIVQHPDGYPVKVLNGCYLDPIYGRVSNWWSWQRVGDNGELVGPVERGYGW